MASRRLNRLTSERSSVIDLLKDASLVRYQRDLDVKNTRGVCERPSMPAKVTARPSGGVAGGTIQLSRVSAMLSLHLGVLGPSLRLFTLRHLP